jgi:hypothetical protein
MVIMALNTAANDWCFQYINNSTTTATTSPSMSLPIWGNLKLYQPDIEQEKRDKENKLRINTKRKSMFSKKYRGII